MQEQEQDEEVYIPFGNLAVELIENSATGGASDNVQHSSNTEIDYGEQTDNAPKDESEFESTVLIKEETEEGLTQRYVEDFIYSNTSETIGGSSSSDFEGRQLSKFPKIAKAIQGSNSETIEALYSLLFLRNAWDKQEILVQRILNFTGFNCEENSDDHFNREMMLHSLADNVLISVAGVLNIEHIKVKPIYFEKEKARLVSLILKFLNRPPLRKRGPRQSTLDKKADETKTPVRKRKRRKKVLTPVKRIGGKVPSPTKQNEMKSLKEQISNNLAGLFPDPNASLKDSETCKSDSKSAADSKKADESALSATVNVSVPTKKKLKDFPNVTKCVRKTPEELLLDIHFLLFSEVGEVHKLKRNILDFKGFAFESDSEEYDERRDFLERMSDKTVNDVAKSFSLDEKDNKDETILHILTFLKEPKESYIKELPKTEGGESSGLSDIDELDIEEMFESDDSVTCEVVPKRVECIDLISSGDESDKERKRAARLQKNPTLNMVKPPASTNVKPPAPTQTLTPIISQVRTTTFEPGPTPTGKRTLRDFETIGKIVNTHPDEYLVDIYDLLYLKKHEPRTLRKEILDFPGFDFIRGSQEYVKRKLLLDRMLYNSVRRIYNTLIHTSTEVKMFSKPAMITEIFDFLLKLPDKDTSIINIQNRINKPASSLPFSSVNNKVVALAPTDDPSSGKQPLGVVTPPVSIPSQPGKLSDLKRVFQRVACFPCEYLIDVHKLLFMTDCDTKVIRQNIFGFKGFTFDVDSSEFQQRKMYLEYLTFHSLRKISSVLTTKTVDLRNSTKHELASHLTDVLAEYTNTYFDGTETTPQITGTTTTATSTNSTVTAAATVVKLNIPQPTETSVEQIVVTPVIQPMCPSSESPTPDKDSSEDSNQMANEESGQQESSVTSMTEEPKAEATSTQHATSTSRRKRKVQPVRAQLHTEQEDVAQFSDINLPEVESYRQMYGQNLNIYPPNVVNFGGAGLYQQSLPHLVPQTMSIPIIHALPSQTHVQNQVYAVHSALPPPPVTSLYPGDIMVPVECILTEDQDPVVESVPKKAKTSSSVSKQSIDVPKKSKFSNEGSKTSLHDKIRDAMNEADEEECDKPLSSFLGHPNDRILKQQICDIVEQTDLQDITINTVIQKIFNMYPKFDLNYRKEYIKSTLRSVLYRLGDQKISKDIQVTDKGAQDSPDCSVSTTFSCENPEQSQSPPISRILES